MRSDNQSGGAELWGQKLQTQFGFKEFRPQQVEALDRLAAGENLLVLLPTGGGKSLIYQMMAAENQGLVLVITPLIALMDDQVLKAKSHGLRAEAIHSNLDTETREKRLRQLSSGQLQMLFVTPERFRKPEFREALATQNLRLLAIDEAHCISQWGHDFRPDYSRLGEIRSSLGNPQTLAVTATATPAVQKDILKVLGMEDAEILNAPMQRPALSLNVHEVYGIDEKLRSIVGLSFQAGGPVVVYFSLIQTLYKIAEELTRLNIPFLVYHGQLNARERLRNLKEFLASNNIMMLATPAFGLGVDKPDIRAVIHAEVPGSTEAYFQEVGRAGRDGKESFAHTLYDQDDIAIQREFLKWGNPDREVLMRVYRLIETRHPELDSRGFDYIRDQINFYNRRDFRGETAVNLLERWGAIEVDPKSRFPFKAVAEPSAQDLESMNTEAREKNAMMKLLDLVRLLQLESGCRQQQVVEYFGQTMEPCGICDLCRKAAESLDIEGKG